jgi:phytol kinase
MEWRPDYTALILSFVYVFAVIGIAELMRLSGRRSAAFTRKFVHIGVGMLIVGIALLFRVWYLALIPPASFVLINAVSYLRGTFQAMEGEDRGNLGTIYFPIAFGAIIYACWGLPALMVAAMMPLTWGDAMGALVGGRLGANQYTIWGHRKSVEGSVAMLFWSWVTTSLALFAMPYLAGNTPINWLVALLQGGAVAVIATIVEAVTPWGMDNLSIPAVSCGILFLLYT